MIWFKEYSVEELNQRLNVGLSQHLKMKFSHMGDDSLTVSMLVGPEHWQPYQVLHGGASVALAETAGSCAANLVIDNQQFAAVGQEINANHIRAFKQGELKAVAKPLHIGKRSHVWEIKMTDVDEELVCVSRLTMAIIPRK